MSEREEAGGGATPRSPIVVSQNEAGRLDSYLGGALPQLGRRAIRRHIEQGHVRVNGRVARKGQQVVAGDVIRLSRELLRRPSELRPQPDLAVRVVLEDPDCIVVDKPAGMPAVALDASDTGTLANFLVGRYPETRTAGRSPLEGGLVHRLDNGTSGLLLAARSREVYGRFRRQFAEQAVSKQYWAIVEGDVAAPGRMERPIAHLRRRSTRMQVSTESAGAGGRHGGRAAVTSYRPRERFGAATLLEVVIETGVRHQIRAHLAAMGHPVVGDSLYGASGAPDAARPLLHARRFGFHHPRTGVTVFVVAPPPADFRSALARLRARPREGAPRPGR